MDLMGPVQGARLETGMKPDEKDDLKSLPWQR